MNKLIEKIKEMSKNPKGKAFLFFGFYIVFFAFVFIFINLSKSTLTYGNDYEKSNSSYTFNLNKLFVLEKIIELVSILLFIILLF